MLGIALAAGMIGMCVGFPAHAGPDQDTVRGFWREVFARPRDFDLAQTSPIESARADLGRRLFNSAELSGDRSRACASCHDPDHAFTDGRKQAMGRDGQPLARNTPTLYNLRWATAFNWDGSADSLEQQALGPLLSENELGGDMPNIVKRVSGDMGLMQVYAKAFPGEPHVASDGVLAALSAYIRTLVSPATRFDDWISGDAEALNENERAGFDLFTGKGGCVACHVGWRFSDDKLHDIGLALGASAPTDPAARADAQPGTPGIFTFKTPTLRAVSKTAPYMHDGRFDSLDQVVEHYAQKVRARRGLSPGLAPRLDLTPGERAELVAFLKTL